MAKDAEGTTPADVAQLVDDVPCGIAVTDPDGRFQYVNGTLARWIGRPRSEIEQQLALPDILTLPGRLFYETHLAPMLRLQGFAREISCMVQPAEAAPLPVLLNAMARRDADGALLRVDYTLFDARERHTYERELRRAQLVADELAAIVRTSPNAIARITSCGIVKSWNAGAARLLGPSEEDAIDRPITDLVVLAEQSEGIALPLAGAERVFETRLANGRDVEVTLAPIGDGTDAQDDWSLILRDITRQRAAERRLNVMVDEMRHRVKNTLGVVLGIARQTLQRGASDAFVARIQALARAHDILGETNRNSTGLLDVLRLIVQEGGGPDKVRVEGPDVRVTAQQATSLSMAFHELVTNATKYGALSTPGGHVAIDFDWIGPPGADSRRLRLVWEEKGGPPVTRPGSPGFGTRLIGMVLESDLGAEVEMSYPRTGFRCEAILAL